LTRTTSKAALSGIRVVEFAVFAAGPVVGKHFGEHGAEVIRIESNAQLDGFRVHYPPFKDDRPGIERGGCFALFNDQVLGVTLNLKHPKAVALARKLVSQSDVVIENFAPGVMERLGLEYSSLREVKPDIIMLSSCNQGQTGRRATQRGFGSQLTSMSGFTHLSGYSGAESPMLLYGPYVDFVAVGFGFIAVLAALDYRRRTGKGQHIDLSQYETGIQFVIPALLDAQVNDRVHHPDGNRDPHAAPHGVYPCTGDDQWCAIAVFGDEEWQTFCRAAERPDWANDQRFTTHENRKRHEDELDKAIAQWTRQFDPHDIVARLQAASVRAGMVQSVGDVFSCPQLVHRQQWVKLDHPEFGSYEHEAPPFILSETPAELNRTCPLLGEHNDYVFEKIVGLSPEEIGRLKEEDVIA
jgi:crotonobetainyl-CoA:carnitine CoA-transferase CaiB-like acyl-CoA transferase